MFAGTAVPGMHLFVAAARAAGSPWRRLAAAAAAAALAVLLLPGLACDECTSPPDCPPETIGTVEGFVLGGGEPARLQVELVPAREEQPGGRYEVHSDSAGWYALTAPAGSYYLLVGGSFYYAGGSLVTDRWSAHALDVSGPALRVDVDGAAARLRLTVPPTLRGERVWVRLGREDGSYLRWYESHAGARSDTGLVRELFFPFIRPGLWAVALDFPNSPRVYLPATLDEAEASICTLGTSATRTITATLPEPAWISGEITGSWQRLGSHPRVGVYAADSTSSLYEEELYDDPGYRLMLPMAVAVRVAVEFPGHVRWIGGTSYSSATLFTPEPGQEITGVDLACAAIACIVTGPGVTVSYHGSCRLHDAGGALVMERATSGGNPVIFDNLDAGTYFLEFVPCGWSGSFSWGCPSPQTWHRQWFDGADSLGNATPISIAGAGDVVTIMAHLQAGGCIRGRVVRAGQPAPGLSIVIRRTGGSLSSTGAALSGADGAFEIVGASDGGYLVGVRNPSNTATWWYPGDYDPARATAITITDHNTITGLEWEVPF